MTNLKYLSFWSVGAVFTLIMIAADVIYTGLAGQYLQERTPYISSYIAHYGENDTIELLNEYILVIVCISCALSAQSFTFYQSIAAANAKNLRRAWCYLCGFAASFILTIICFLVSRSAFF